VLAPRHVFITWQVIPEGRPMQFSRLSLFAQRVHVARPLPFNVYDHDRTLLLARGQLVESPAQLEALFTRGALVDIAELQQPVQRVRQASREELPGLWAEGLSELGNALRQSSEPGFLSALEGSVPAVEALVARDPDLAIFQVLRQDGNANLQYGVNHSMHAAITTQLVAQRLGWPADESALAFKVALTMNLGMLALQGQLAVQVTPPDADQRAAIQAHPELSRMLLELAGVHDQRWLQAVAQHHESPDGKGYPYGLRDPCPVADLVRRADIYTAKLSPRRSRDALAADLAGRQMFMSDPGHPMTTALVKEFGIYPPGCWVRLASGETGLVVRRGPTVMAPEVLVLTGQGGRPLPVPQRRDTSLPAYAVRGVVGPHERRPPVPEDQLLTLAVA
jgi:HD domain